VSVEECEAGVRMEGGIIHHKNSMECLHRMRGRGREQPVTKYDKVCNIVFAKITP